MSNFEPNSVIRGFQLTIVGTLRALQNPGLFKLGHFHQAALAVAAGIVIHIVVHIPVIAIKFFIWSLSWVSDLEHVTWDDTVLNGLEFLSHSVLQVPFLLLTLMRYITPTLDEIFMQSLKWVDTTYAQKHKYDQPDNLRAMYYPNMAMYATGTGTGTSRPAAQALLLFARRYGRKVGIILITYLASLLPVIGRFVMPAASFYAFRNSVGTNPAAIIFGAGLVLPKRFIITFLHTYFASRSLMRELLEPYFSRIRYTPEQRRRWFLDREGVLFGFAFSFTIALKTPFVGVLMYGVAEASTAYLITKITDPPPPPSESDRFAESQVTWKNKHEFLRLPLNNLDRLNILAVSHEHLTAPADARKNFS